MIAAVSKVRSMENKLFGDVTDERLIGDVPTALQRTQTVASAGNK